MADAAIPFVPLLPGILIHPKIARVATGLNISWQSGPLGRGADRQAPNGCFVETVLIAAIDRLRFYQTVADGRFACAENERAIAAIELAGSHLRARTAARENRGVEGTHSV